MSSSPLPYQPLFGQAEQWFDRARASLLGALPCGRGCCLCCIGPFAITVLDADALEAGLTRLPAETRSDVQARAQQQAAAMEHAYPQLKRSRYLTDWNDDELDRLAEQFADLPCPALDADGSCRVYAFRPLTCRTMGIPVEEDGVIQGACEVQTSTPLIKLSSILRTQEDDLAAREVRALQNRRDARKPAKIDGEEMWLQYGFLSRSDEC